MNQVVLAVTSASVSTRLLPWKPASEGPGYQPEWGFEGGAVGVGVGVWSGRLADIQKPANRQPKADSLKGKTD